MGRLILVGVVHRDPEGSRHLSKIFEKIRPRALGLEFSPLGLLWRETKSQELLAKLEELLGEYPASTRAHADVRLIAEALRLPFEYQICLDYASKQDVPLHLMDLNWISREELPKYEKEILTRENLAALLSRGPARLEEKIRAAYARAYRCLNSGGSLREIGIIPPWSTKRGLLREVFLACRIRKMASIYDVFVYVGGWVHIAEDPLGFSLAGLLRDLQPQRVLLRSADTMAFI